MVWQSDFLWNRAAFILRQARGHRKALLIYPVPSWSWNQIVFCPTWCVLDRVLMTVNASWWFWRHLFSGWPLVVLHTLWWSLAFLSYPELPTVYEGLPVILSSSQCSLAPFTCPTYPLFPWVLRAFWCSPKLMHCPVPPFWVLEVHCYP